MDGGEGPNYFHFNWQFGVFHARESGRIEGISTPRGGTREQRGSIVSWEHGSFPGNATSGGASYRIRCVTSRNGFFGFLGGARPVSSYYGRILEWGLRVRVCRGRGTRGLRCLFLSALMCNAETTFRGH